MGNRIYYAVLYALLSASIISCFSTCKLLGTSSKIGLETQCSQHAFRRQVARKCLSVRATVALDYEVDAKGRQRLQLRDEGWSKWSWKGTGSCPGPFECNYIQAGNEGVPIVLVHGFGAHAYHWRYQIPALSKKHRVYSLCLLGYGWSPKAVVEYSGEVWGQQVADFVREVVGEPAVICGNSIGAIAALSAASIDSSMASGLVMLNAAGRFDSPPESASAQPADGIQPAPAENPIAGWLKRLAARVTAAFIFFSTRSRIGVILRQALEAFQELSLAGSRTKTTVPEMLDRLRPGLPVLLVWGQRDPWMTPSKGLSVLKACEARGLACRLEPLEAAGHCPHDDDPDAVNDALARFCAQLTPP